MKYFILTLAAVFSIGLLGSAMTMPAYAACTDANDCVTKGLNAAGGSSNTKSAATFIKAIVSALLYVLGAISVVMIIVGGIRYSTSNGDASHVKAAKDTIMYAVVGLVVALLAYSIVNFILTNIK